MPNKLPNNALHFPIYDFLCFRNCGKWIYVWSTFYENWQIKSLDTLISSFIYGKKCHSKIQCIDVVNYFLSPFSKYIGQRSCTIIITKIYSLTFIFKATTFYVFVFQNIWHFLLNYGTDRPAWYNYFVF